MFSLNILSYLIYGIITFYITVKVGWICYKNGIHFIQLELQDEQIAHSVNKLLLVGYYLLNLGYALSMIYTWKTIHNHLELLSTLSYRTAYIILGLGLMHYFNIAVITLLRKKSSNTHSKTIKP